MPIIILILILLSISQKVVGCSVADLPGRKPQHIFAEKYAATNRCAEMASAKFPSVK
jgi:hypothetical protein